LFAIKYTGDDHIGIMSISALLKLHGYSVEAVNADYGSIKAKLKQGIPTVLGFYTPTIYCSYYLLLNRRIKKEFDVFSVFGGPHPTCVPEMIQEDGVDGVCVGEGEFAMLDLLERLTASAHVRDIMNWQIKENGIIYRNPVRQLIEDLDSLPHPDRSLFANSRFLTGKKYM
jgi:radical SAM superfamily enzyme YgiQ (UPF0313 family)